MLGGLGRVSGGQIVLLHTRHQMTLLSYCPALFVRKDPGPPQANSSKFTGHVSPIHQYPH